MNGALFLSLENDHFYHQKSMMKMAINGDGNRRRIGRPPKYKIQQERLRAYAASQKAYIQRKKKLIHRKSNSIQWSTPDNLFKALDDEFHFTFDVCADPGNAKCAHYFTKEQDGLRQRWNGVCWMNPPYGAEIEHWVQKAYDSSLYGVTVVCLLPARTDTRWWHQYVLPLPKDRIRFLPGRQRFSGKDRAPFPSAVVMFCPPAS